MSLKAFWQNKTTREKRWITLAGCVVLIGLGYHVIWTPLNEKLESTSRTIESDKALLSWMQQNKDSVLKSRGVEPKTSNVPLFQLVEQTFKDMGEGDVSPKLTRIDDSRVSIVFNKVAFSEFYQTLESISKTHGLTVTKFSATRDEDAGYASIQMTLMR